MNEEQLALPVPRFPAIKEALPITQQLLELAGAAAGKRKLGLERPFEQDLEILVKKRGDFFDL